MLCLFDFYPVIHPHILALIQGSVSAKAPPLADLEVQVVQV